MWVPARRRACFAIATLLTVFVEARAVPSVGEVCTVPGSHSSLGRAVEDPACSEVSLAAGAYPESVVISRSLSISGPEAETTLLQGFLQVAGTGTTVLIRNLQVEADCLGGTLASLSGARIKGENLRVTRSPAFTCPPPGLIFADGFESGDTSAWSDAAP